MLGDQAFKSSLHRVGQRIVRGTGISKLRIASGGRNRLGMKHRPRCRFPPERAVSMPKLVAQHKISTRVVLAEDATVLVKIGDVEYFPMLYPCSGSNCPGPAPNARRYLKWPIDSRKGDLLLILKTLTGQHANGVCVHCALDCPLDVFVNRLAQVEVRDRGDEERMKRCDREFHGARFSLAQDC